MDAHPCQNILSFPKYPLGVSSSSDELNEYDPAEDELRGQMEDEKKRYDRSLRGCNKMHFICTLPFTVYVDRLVFIVIAILMTGMSGGTQDHV